MTVAQFLRSSLRLIQVTNPTAAELNDALEALNLMLSDWSTSSLGIHKLTRVTFPTVARNGAYNIGTGATIDTTRPNKIGISFCRDMGQDSRIDPISAEDYADIGDKSIESTPLKLYYEKTYPLGVVFLWPVPDKVYDVFLYLHSPLASYSSISDDLNLPPEYHTAIKYNLAIAIAPEFGTSVSQEVAVSASETLKSMKRLHSAPVPTVCTNPFKGGGMSWGSGGISDGNQLILDGYHFPIY